MKDDPMLTQLAALAREEASLGDPRLDALLRGELSPDETAALLAESAEARELAALLEPLPAADHDAIVASALGAVASKADAVVPAKTKTGEAKVPETSSAPATGKVVPFPRLRAIAIAGSALAAAAAAVLWMGRAPSVPELPGYELSFTGGDQASRAAPGAGTGTPRLAPGSRLTLVVRPSTSVTGEIAGVAFAAPAGGAMRAVPVAPERSPDGSLRFAGTREQLLPGLTAGPAELTVFVARPDALPGTPEAAARCKAQPSPACRALTQPVLLVEP